MGPRWFVMMKRWVQNPPSPAQIKLVFGIVVICLVLFAVEQFWGWPEWLTPASASSPR